MKKIFIALILIGCGAPTEEAPAVSEAVEPLTVPLSVGTVNPGEEGLRCIGWTSPGRELFISAFSVTKTSIHHLNLWRMRAAVPDGEQACPKASPYGEFVFDDAVASEFRQEPADGVFHIAAKTSFLVDVHVINTTEAPVEASAEISLHESEKRSPILFGFELRAGQVPAPVEAGATVTARLTTPAKDVTLYSVMGHMHAHGVVESFSVRGQELYRTESWSDPLFLPTTIRVSPTDRIEWSCTVRNTSAVRLTWGANSIQTSEMCSVVGMADAEWDVVGTAAQ